MMDKTPEFSRFWFKNTGFSTKREKNCSLWVFFWKAL